MGLDSSHCLSNRWQMMQDNAITGPWQSLDRLFTSTGGRLGLGWPLHQLIGGSAKIGQECMPPPERLSSKASRRKTMCRIVTKMSKKDLGRSSWL
mmetsp:Transcript_30592/g.49191  ORF Transcript_30592/g.49191 Transcript_30592/m.49191 type:complete len:95 (-) Transcript_30592:264-548(-)